MLYAEKVALIAARHFAKCFFHSTDANAESNENEEQNR